MRRTIVCLANSYKHQGRCIAGMSLEDGSWIRPRGQASDGSLQPSEYVLDDGSEPRLLDVIEVELHYPIPSDWHPEDWQIAPTPWRLIERSATADRCRDLSTLAGKGTTILRGYRDRMAATEIREKPLQSSLALICPSEIHWWIREDRGKRKYRALFHRNHVTYDFALTDPRWQDQLKSLPDGIYAHSTLAANSEETLLTISLSEDFYGWHYKLVAGVIVPAAPAPAIADSLPPWMPSPSRLSRWLRRSSGSASPRP